MWQPPGSFSPVMPPHAYPQYPPTISLMPDNLKGHQIPMLSDSSASQNSDEIPYQQPPLQQIPPGPQSTLPQTGGIDWTIISGCSPDELVKTNDIDTLTAIIQSFIHAQFTQTEAQLMPNPLTAKFFHILQIAVRYLLDCQTELKENLEESEKSIQLLKAKLKNLSASLTRAKDEVKKSERIKESTEKCIVCGRRFKNIGYLDGHVQRRHGALVPAWRSLRTGQMQGMSDFSEQLENLRQEVAKAHHELERRAQIESTKAPVTHIVSHSDEQIRLLRELISKQDEMLNQARMNEDKQLSFRKEMRDQLDDAVFALQDAQKQLDVQAARISQIPIIPPPAVKPNDKPIQPDELGSSLTEQIMKPSFEKQRIAFNLDKLLSENDEKKDSSEPDWKKKIANFKDDLTKTQKKDEDIIIEEEEEEDESSKGRDERDKKHQKVLDKLQKEDESEKEKIEIKPVKKVLTKREQIEDLLKRGKMLVKHNIDTSEQANRELSIATISEATLHQVDVKLAQLKRLRPYAPLSAPFVSKKMAESSPEFKQTYAKLSAFVGSEAPIDNDEARKSLFQDRKTRFPLLPPVHKLTQKQLLAQRKRQGKKDKESDSHKVPKIPDEIISEAGRKLPFKQRMASNRPRLLPGDSDVEIVDRFSSEINSEESVGYMEDPDYYKRFRTGEKKEKDFEELHVSSPSSSSIIQPLADGADDTKVFNLSEFSSDSEREQITKKISGNIRKTKEKNQVGVASKNKNKDSSSKSKTKMLSENDDDDDAFAFSSGDDDNINRSRKSKDQFMFEEEEEVDSSNSTQELPIKTLSKTKTIKVKTAGSGDFDVTKKQTLKGSSDSDAMFNLMSDLSSDDTISLSDDDNKNKSKKKTKNKK